MFKVNTPDVVLKCQYDFDKWFKKVGNPLSGATKTKNDPNTVQAWMFERNSRGLAELRWQPSASLVEPWLGQNGNATDMGFVKLKGRPVVLTSFTFSSLNHRMQPHNNPSIALIAAYTVHVPGAVCA